MDIKKLSYLFNLSEENIIKHQDYLNFNIHEYCCPYTPIPYINLESNDYVSAIEYLITYFRNVNEYDFLNKILHEAMQINKKKSIKYDNSLSSYIYRDQVILQYILNKPNTFILTVWPIASKYIDQISISLQRNGIVPVIRKINLSYLGAQNLVNHLYNKIILTKTSVDRKLNFINSKLLYTGFKEDEMNDFYVIVFENINDLSISGSDSGFKTQLRQEIIKFIKDDNLNSQVEISDTIHINDFFYETIEYAQIYFHNQTLLHYQRVIIENFLDNDFNPSFLRLNAIKKWQTKNLNTLENQRMMLLTGSCLYTMGIRKSSDIDSIFINIKSQDPRETELANLFYKDFFNKESKIPFATSGIPETIAWKESWTITNNIYYSSCNNELDDFLSLMNPDLFFYYNGIKVINFEMALQFKLSRYRPSDFVDFIVITELYPNITELEIYLAIKEIWKNKKDRSIQKINELILLNFERYLTKDKQKININKYLLN